MKRQINPTLKAHLIRSAFYLLLLMAVCAIPFALAQLSFNGRTIQATHTGRSLTLATPSSCSWAGAPDMPSADTRSAGVFFPANGKFYAMGGRDENNVELTNPFEFDPVTHTWATKSATYPDGFTNNMACGVLTDSGTPYIYCVGGSNFASQTGTGRVFRYNPITDTLTTVVGGDWPPGAYSILPGGFTVFNNTLVVLGGFDIPSGHGSDQIWQFTPSPVGWVQKSAVLPDPLGYLPTTTIGSHVYTGGGAHIIDGIFTDATKSFMYDPVSDSISAIADIPRPTSNTRAVNFCGLMYVLGGAFNAPSNEVDIYDPASNTWSLGDPFPTAGRNFAADTDGSNNIWKGGGYAIDGATIATTEYFNCPVSPCASASPTPTATATPGPIQLRGQKKKVEGVNTVRLNWKGATSLGIDVYRNDVLIATTPNAPPFLYTDFTGDTGRAQYTYRVCEAGTQTCSNDLRVRFQE